MLQAANCGESGTDRRGRFVGEMFLRGGGLATPENLRAMIGPNWKP